ncbi:MAG: hypothetical protein V3S64_00225 [bacterium]
MTVLTVLEKTLPEKTVTEKANPEKTVPEKTLAVPRPPWSMAPTPILAVPP